MTTLLILWFVSKIEDKKEAWEFFQHIGSLAIAFDAVVQILLIAWIIF